MLPSSFTYPFVLHLVPLSPTMTPVTISIGSVDFERDMNATQIGQIIVLLSEMDDSKQSIKPLTPTQYLWLTLFANTVTMIFLTLSLALSESFAHVPAT